MSNYQDPRWYENQPNNNNVNQPLPPQPTHDDFDHYPFLPIQEYPANQQSHNQAINYPPGKPPTRFKRVLGQLISLIAIIIAAFVAGWFSHQFIGDSFAFNQNNQSKAYSQLFQEAWDKVDQNYVDRKSIDYKKMSYAAINAMLESLGDTGHTRFMDPKTTQEENQQLSGKFTGVGIYLHQDPTSKQLVVTSTIPDSPAEKAGVKTGDIITAVNGVSIKGKDVNGVSTLIQGPAGSNVKITVDRPSESQTHTFDLTRAEIQVPNVIMHYFPESHTAHIQIIQFADGISNQLKDDVLKARSMGATNIVLDLRNNPGGFLSEAINTVSLFVKDGNVLLEQDSSGKRTPVPVNGNPIDTTSKLVVLINENSASAAEIVSGSLKEHHRATLVGEKTFGTGTVLEPFPLADGSTLLLGTQEWLTPNGHFIRKDATNTQGGITPNIVIAMQKESVLATPNEENQEHLSEQQILNSKDPQLIKALHILQGQ